MRVLEELNAALHELMTRDVDLHVLGEDILDPYGGAFKVTKGLSSAFPERVITMPISEAAIVGFASGLAMRGKPAICEVMFGDFLALAMDQILNHAAKVRWMFDGAVTVPLVIRAPMGAGRGYGPTHSQSIEKHFCGIPGLRVLAVNAFQSPGALLRHAYELREPVLFIENKIGYAKPVEPDRLRTYKKPDVVLLTYGGMTEACVLAAEKLFAEEEVEVEVAPIERLWPFDVERIARVARRSTRFLVVEEGTPGWGFAAQCAQALLENARTSIRFSSLSAPDHPIPSSRHWEAQVLPNASAIAAAALSLLEA